MGGAAGGRQRDRHDQHRERQEPLLQPPGARPARGEPESRALYLYPTKALAQDQARALPRFGSGLRPAIYDGDTPRRGRWQSASGRTWS